ncbi:amidohydrolase family protein [Bombilactobacillus bombi]|uniref:metal-dependent hydrolase family protein n=1 Tax=Bombilactobacillus bombi TaxID=1303590 RepID=UPI000E57D0F7|nr:amidohydrolase family protein [Bombilactobacillus bombi]AXX64779.1 amidohydrolase family protein [Bombilactobacillus bombi]
MTKITFINANIYQHEQQDFQPQQYFTVDTDTQRITAMGQGVPSESIVDQIVDFHNQYVMPGIMNAHTHIGSTPTYWAEQESSIEGADPKAIQTMFAIKNMQDLINHGVTYIRNVGAAYDIDIPIKIMQHQKMIAGPRVMTSGKAFTMTGGHGDGSGIEVDGVDEMIKGVRQSMKNGVDNIKLMVTGGVLRNGETPDDIQFNEDEVKAAVREAHHKNKTVAAHAQGNAGVKEAAQAGVDTVEHAFDIDDETIDIMKEHKTFVVPTMNAMYAIYKYGEDTVADWARQKVIINIKKHFASIKKAAAAGIPIAMGTDAGTPYNGFENESAYEMQLYVEKAGMTPAQAIDTATINCAKAMHVSKDYGEISVGKVADFIVMKDNPIQDIKVIQKEKAVYQGGVCVHQPA